MPSSPLTRRVQILEEKVELLERLPARIEALELQFLQFRDEVRVEFSATRDGLRREIGSLRGEMGGLRGEMGGVRDELRAEIQGLEKRLDALISEGDEETRRYMRVLHEDVIARIATIGEGGRSRE
jgi:hypothetical protein